MFRSPFEEVSVNPKKNPSDIDCKLRMMEQGYSEDCRVLEFRIGYIQKDSIGKFVDVIGSYNAFKADKVKKAMKSVEDIVEYYEIGRESSPVMYIKWKSWSDDKEANLKRIEHAFVHDAKADEFSMDNNKVIRVWWD